jgi:hypothetical protein
MIVNPAHILLTAMFLSSGIAIADGFDFASNPKDLIGGKVLEVGSATKLESSPNDLSRTIVAFAGYCYQSNDFRVSSMNWIYSEKAALLISNINGGISLGFLENGSGYQIKVNVVGVNEVECPKGVGYGHPSDPQKAMELVKKRQEENKQYYEKMRKDMDAMKAKHNMN